jgi:DNA-binding NarL/FixJ family response regulator
VRVLVVDDHAAIRTGVRFTVQDYSGLEVVGEAANGEEAVAQARKLHPDLIIMDISMPVLDGLSAAEIIMRYYPQTRIVMFSMHEIREFVETARSLGLSGYVAKEEDGASLRLAVDAVLHDQTYFPKRA